MNLVNLLVPNDPDHELFIFGFTRGELTQMTRFKLEGS